MTMAVSVIIGSGHSHASAQVINGCVSKNGSLRIVADSVECADRETPISWNSQGPQGETGPQGEPGAPGPEGPTGSSLRLFDADGNVLGIPWYMPGTSPNGQVFVEAIGLSMLRATLDGNFLMPYIYYELDFCQGQAYVEQSERFTNHLIGPYSAPLPNFFVVPTIGVVSLARYESRASPSGTCLDAYNVLPRAIPIHPFTGTLPFPFPPPQPFYVGLPPEASP